MSPALRTVLAYLVAPLTTPAILALGQAWTEPRGHFVSAFAEITGAGCMTSYPVCWVLGTGAFLLLRRLRRETTIMYTGCAAFAGALAGCVIGSSMTPLGQAYLGIAFALFSAPTGAVFHWIRGGRRTCRA